MNKTSPIRVYDTAKKGRRQCVSCEKFVGVRQKVCACGHEFKKGEKVIKKAVLDKVEQEALDFFYVAGYNGCRRLVYTPAGKCSAKLVSSRKNDVWDWCDSLLLVGKEEGVFYGPSALRYFVREFFCLHDSAGYARVIGHINDWVNQYLEVIDEKEAN